MKSLLCPKKYKAKSRLTPLKVSWANPLLWQLCSESAFAKKASSNLSSTLQKYRRGGQSVRKKRARAHFFQTWMFHATGKTQRLSLCNLVWRKELLSRPQLLIMEATTLTLFWTSKCSCLKTSQAEKKVVKMMILEEKEGKFSIYVMLNYLTI
jgi:hypothetical protein